jgi:hypothetical protein
MNYLRICLLALIALPPCHPLHAQDSVRTKGILIGAHFGVHYLYGGISNASRIRGDISTSVSERTSVNLASNYSGYFGGISFEKFIRHDRLSLSGGLRFSRMTGRIGKDRWMVFEAPFFFYLLKEEGTRTDYVSLREMFQDTDLVSVPLELRYFPFRGRSVRPYAKLGLEVNTKVKSVGYVVFYEKDMDHVGRDITEEFARHGDITAMLHVAGGVRFGKPDNPVFGLELVAPSFFLSGTSGGIVSPTAGFGFQFYAAMPLQSFNKK